VAEKAGSPSQPFSFFLLFPCMKLSTTHTTDPSFFTILLPLADKLLPSQKRGAKNLEAGPMESEIPKIDESDHRTFGELLI